MAANKRKAGGTMKLYGVNLMNFGELEYRGKLSKGHYMREAKKRMLEGRSGWR